MIGGPLGIWPWPILNTLIEISGGSKEDENTVEVTEVIRDEEGRIESVEVIKK